MVENRASTSTSKCEDSSTAVGAKESSKIYYVAECTDTTGSADVQNETDSVELSGIYHDHKRRGNFRYNVLKKALGLTDVSAPIAMSSSELSLDSCYYKQIYHKTSKYSYSCLV